MIFDAINPFHWLKIILSIVLIIVLILLPGWIKLFSKKTFSEVGEMLSQKSAQTFASAWKMSLEFYKNWLGAQLKKAPSKTERESP